MELTNQTAMPAMVSAADLDDSSRRIGILTAKATFRFDAQGRVELPQVVEIAIFSVGIVANAPKEPEIAAAVGPTRGGVAASGDVSGSKRTQRAVRSGLRAIAADGSLTVAYLYKGGLFNRMERFSEALECYEQALHTQEARHG